MTANMKAKMSHQRARVLKASPRVHTWAGFEAEAFFLGRESKPKGWQPTLSGIGFAMAAATSRQMAMMTDRIFMPTAQPAVLRTGETARVRSSWDMGAPMKARPHLVPYSVPTYHLRQEMVEETQSMPVPMPAKTP